MEQWKMEEELMLVQIFTKRIIKLKNKSLKGTAITKFKTLTIVEKSLYWCQDLKTVIEPENKATTKCLFLIVY